jgi:hypothetical protein
LAGTKRSAVDELLLLDVLESWLGRLKVTLPAAISRSAVTAALFFERTRASTPFIRWRVRAEANTTRAKRFSSRSRQSSTVTRAMVGTLLFASVPAGN